MRPFVAPLKTMTAQLWEEFLASVGRLGGILELDDAAAGAIREVADHVRDLEAVNREALSSFIASKPERVPLLALTIRLSQEQLKNILRHHLGTSSWTKLARERPDEVIEMLDTEFGLIARVERDRHEVWGYSHILAERYMSRLKASGAITRGRDLENAVEAIVTELGLPHDMRTRFAGRGPDDAPCDLAIPAGGQSAEIVVGIKGFDSSGSKLTDATREILSMAEVRKPTQFVFVVVDGIGWKSRQSDLKKIHALWDQGRIDGVYTTQGLGAFRDALIEAAARRNLS